MFFMLLSETFYYNQPKFGWLLSTLASNKKRLYRENSSMSKSFVGSRLKKLGKPEATPKFSQNLLNPMPIIITMGDVEPGKPTQ